jgi:hypothetical protein
MSSAPDGMDATDAWLLVSRSATIAQGALLVASIQRNAAAVKRKL